MILEVTVKEDTHEAAQRAGVEIQDLARALEDYPGTIHYNAVTKEIALANETGEIYLEAKKKDDFEEDDDGKMEPSEGLTRGELDGIISELQMDYDISLGISGSDGSITFTDYGDDRRQILFTKLLNTDRERLKQLLNELEELSF